MDRSLFVVMSGARETLRAQASVSNNLANVNTTGFKQDLEQFRSMPVFGPGYPSRVYALNERPATDFDPGPIRTTGRDLDVAVKGDGWIAVQAADGSEAYTRRGDLRISPEGLLQTGDGHPVLGDNGPIAIPPAQKVDIGSDGTISVVPLGEKPDVLAVVDRIKLVRATPEQLEKGEDGLIRLRSGQPAEADAGITLVSGALEGSNVNSVAALVDMIELSRRYELQVKMMKTAEDDADTAAQLLRMV
ncbi:flagellar basal-body rod protein FlgF [Methylomarinovum caldicuralii]|uniref:Flagellar basal-body rod protein FlgF n=1 Tax=Methylomarinovum caldicuralii TaxID=438856 RepID=A0AAU9CE48_9GAMM|nr:flagellar basal-body rod protein FlgF [Methylomarinovum caldicuralii]BCX82924.1 flagellar basal-body rod protein FlgF [Methylomarinovum caldicuralii]